MPSNLENAVRRAFDLNVRFYGELARLGVDYLRDLSSTLGELRPEARAEPRERSSEWPRGESPAARVLVLEAPAGAHASGEFAVTNHLPTVVSTRIATTPFTDASGHEAGLTFTFEPDDIDLQPGEQVVVRVKTRIEDALRPGTTYRGDLTVPDLGGAGIPVIVRRRREAG